jgi:hypothetical protein
VRSQETQCDCRRHDAITGGAIKGGPIAEDVITRGVIGGSEMRESSTGEQSAALGG